MLVSKERQRQKISVFILTGLALSTFLYLHACITVFIVLSNTDMEAHGDLHTYSTNSWFLFFIFFIFTVCGVCKRYGIKKQGAKKFIRYFFFFGIGGIIMGYFGLFIFALFDIVGSAGVRNRGSATIFAYCLPNILFISGVVCICSWIILLLFNPINRRIQDRRRHADIFLPDQGR